MIQKLKNLVQYAAFAAPVFAVGDAIDLKPTGDFSKLGTLTIPNMISGAISLLMLVVALVFFFTLIIGGLKWVMSDGDQKAVEAARSQITNALIGLAIVFAAFAIITLISNLFGLSLTNGLKIPTLNP